MADEPQEKKPAAAAPATPAAGAPATPAAAAPATPAAGAPADAPAPKKSKRTRRLVPRAVANILATFNNTIITISDPKGDTLCWASAGTIGYKGSRKSTPFAAQKAAESVAEKAHRFGVRELEVKVPFMLERGGYIPTIDHLAYMDINLENGGGNTKILPPSKASMEFDDKLARQWRRDHALKEGHA